MNGNELGWELGKDAVLYALVFGILLALAVSALRKLGLFPRGKSLGRCAVIAVGVGGTIVCGALGNVITVEEMVWLMVLYGVSGTPMVIESAWSDYLDKLEEGLK